jgi:membrane glycosyltransferase
MLPLDADSLMAGETVVKHVADDAGLSRLGILQSLVVGMPSKSGLRPHLPVRHAPGHARPTRWAAAWWVGDCGPFWGHNAMVRIAPFMDCHLPVLPGRPPLGGPILSHDQVEATLMRRAGYEVRVLPQSRSGSWEENPPTMLEFTRRDLRWCQGNMQYWRLTDLPGLRPMSRFQLPGRS